MIIMEFTHNIDKNVCNALYTLVVGVERNERTTLDLTMAAADAFRTLPKNARKDHVEWAASQPVSTMTAESLRKRLNECASIIDKFGTLADAESAIDAYNDYRMDNGGKYTFSSQYLASWLVTGKVHGSDTVGKRVHGVVSPSKAETVEGETVETESNVSAPSETLLASMLRNVPNLSMDDRTILIHALQHANDAAAEQNSKILAMV